MTAPVLLFTYNRPEETRQTLAALQKNVGAEATELFVFSDAPVNTDAESGVRQVRDLLRTVTGFRSVTVVEQERNLGLADSVIGGVTKLFREYESLIVLEDDLLTAPNFLPFMNSALWLYRDCPEVWSVSGFSFPLNYPAAYIYDAAFGVRASSWGWATWRERWKKVDWNLSDYEEFLTDIVAKRRFLQGGSDMCRMLQRQKTGRIDSWAIRFCYAQFRNQAYDVFPRVSKVCSIGFGRDATNTGGMGGRFATVLDDGLQTDFSFPEKIKVDDMLLRQFRRRFSFPVRLKYKLLRCFR